MQVYQFSLESAINEWIARKKIRTGSEKTETAYQDTMQGFRSFLAQGHLDLLDNPVDVVRVAAIWASMRSISTRHSDQAVAPSTYNQRLAILSSFYSFMQEPFDWIRRFLIRLHGQKATGASLCSYTSARCGNA